jgi:hypothetical protein
MMEKRSRGGGAGTKNPPEDEDGGLQNYTHHTISGGDDFVVSPNSF